VRRAVNRWHQEDEGLGLIEVMIAVFVLSVSLLAIGSVAISSLTALRIARDREHATNAASGAIEAARARDFDELSLATTDDVSTLPPEVRTLLGVASGCVQGERPIQDAASADPVPLAGTTGTNGAMQIYTVVTWAEQSCATTTNGELKRVTSLATWRDGGQLHSVRNETLVAPAGRGLPVPNFEVKPPEASVEMTPAQADANATRCVEQQLRNLGAADRYEWELVSVDGLSGAPVRSGTTGWRTPNGKWGVEAHFEHPPVDPPRAGAEPSTNTALMQDLDGNGLPESDVQVAAGEQATITFCYEPTAADAGDFTAHIDVVSRFDDRRRERVSHHVSVIANAEKAFHLQDRDDTQGHTRRDGGGNADKQYPPYAMNPLNPGSEDRSQLLAPALGHWSTEVTASLPGVRLRRELLPTGSNTSEPEQLRTLDYRYQVSAAQQLLTGGIACAGQASASGCLVLWTAPPAALGDTSAGALPVTVDLEVKFDIMDDAEKQRIWPSTAAVTTTLSYQHTTAGWERKEIPLNFTTGTTLLTNQRLRVRITCLSTSQQDCAIAYDTVDTPSNLVVRLQ
jgi:Tfp pilus assembly protein PilV